MQFKKNDIKYTIKKVFHSIIFCSNFAGKTYIIKIINTEYLES